MKTAVLYLRVSTTGQVETDYDPEGISIPAQRAACTRKAEQMGVAVVGEYVEPGKSATTMEKRPVFQEMLERLRTERDADYVIVYNLSRLNRNRVDDAKVLMLMRALKVTLVSAQESIDETPAGQLMHGILAAFNEYRSNADGADIRYKMGQKAKAGGTLGKAPLGYLNVRDTSLGREVRTVAVDDERAPYVKLAFDLYATGEWSMTALAAELERRGLRTRPTAARPSMPVSKSKLQQMLRDPYYSGSLRYQGEIYPGRHTALVAPDVFARVQSVIDSRGASGERLRRWPHYLKGTIWCADCHRRGVDSRLIIHRAVNRHGEAYFYFFCTARQSGTCRSAYLPVHQVEDLVLRHYQGITLPEGFAEAVRGHLDSTLADEQTTTRLIHASVKERLRKLDAQEERLLDLAADGNVAGPKVRERLRTISGDRDALRRELDGATDTLSAGAAVVRDALALIEDVPSCTGSPASRGGGPSTRPSSPASTLRATGLKKND